MAHELIMPKLGMAMVEGTVTAWKKKPGDLVKKGEGVVEISSEKIEMELESPADGVLLQINVAEGGVVPIGTVLGAVGEPGELGAISAAVPVAVAAQGGAAVSELAQAKVTSSGAVDRLAVTQLSTEQPPGALPNETQSGGAMLSESQPTGAQPAGGNPSREGIKISPVARKMAEEAGLDYTRLKGTGPQGRITKEDVEQALCQEKESGTAPTASLSAHAESSTTPPQSTGTTHPATEVVRIPVVGMRKVIAERMHSSLLQSAQLTMTMQADLTELLALKEKVSAETVSRYQVKLSVTDLIARATVLALKKHKQMNSAFMGSHIEQYESIHLGMAVALEKGLVVPVIRDAEQKTVVELAQQIKSLSERARLNQLTAEEMSGSTFTISNLGGFGVESFTPVLNPPETGILGIGASKEVPVFVGDSLERRSQLTLCLTFDHRVLDGAPAAAFLATVKRYLEEPYSLLV